MDEEKKVQKQGTGSEEENEEAYTLEQLFSQLDEILAAMEDPEISLEDSFSLYEAGMKKVRQCNEKLDTVEKKMLVIANDGSEVPFEE